MSTQKHRSATCFAPGNTPWNKGMKGYSANSPTRFQKGSHAPRWVPIGTEKVNGYGYLERKVAESHDRKIAWKAVHKLNWEAINGPIPAGHTLSFRDGNKANVEVENLELITRADLLSRNTMHRLPAELREVIHLKCRLTRKINEHDQ